MHAQWSNERVRWFELQGDTLIVDTLSLIPGSVQISVLEPGQYDSSSTIMLDPSSYTIAHFNATIIFHPRPTGRVCISYQVFPYLFTERAFTYDKKGYDSTALLLSPYTVSTGKTNQWASVKGLDYSGSFARGISFGNNQDVVVNSTFNLQMSGRLQNDVDIAASITDNNIPIQPDGTTQQLQEFDKVFIRLSKGGHQLTMGDFELARQEGYFLQYYKKLQGASYTGTFGLSDGSKLQTGISAAVARGIYTRQDIAVIEGTQGPYKLKGINGETFIIILAGTERVYIDGKLMTRGSEQDYIIDYNSGEVTFTPRILLTKDKRVVVEFEYSDKNYFRTLLYSGSTWTSADNVWKARVQIYNEQDSKNQPLDQTLDASDRTALMNAGDSVSAIYAPGIDSIAFDASRILYRMTDSLGYDSVFVYSIDPEDAFYALSFTELGAGNGNYIVSNTTTNGKVYSWVAPVDGIMQGTAEPVVLLIAPRKSRMITVGGTYQPDERTQVTTEFAVSDNDPNTFSETGNSDNTGVASRTAITHTIKGSGDNVFTVLGNYEFAQRTFIAPERYRPVEFNRDWNIYDTDAADEHYANAGFQWKGWRALTAGYQSSVFIRSGNYTGFLQNGNAGWSGERWQWQAKGSYLLADNDSSGGKFFRPNINLTRTFPAIGHLQTGVAYEAEHNYTTGSSDSLLSTSFYYDQYSWFVGNADTAKKYLRGDIIYREDAIASTGIFKPATTGITYQLQGRVQVHPQRTWQWQVHYRTLEIADTSLTTQRNEQSLLGRLQQSSSIKKGFITSDLLYEVGTGREPQRSYTYVETEPGAGTFTWNDYNENGVQELNEFELATFADEANFIQVLIPTDTYIQTNSTAFNYAIGVNPRALWNASKGFEGLLGKCAVQSNLQMNRKVFDDQTLTIYNPFATIEDTLLVSSNIYWVNTFFINRTGSVFGADYSYNRNFNKQVITIGPESRGKEEQVLNVRYRPWKAITGNIVLRGGSKNYYSPVFPDKNYVVPYQEISPKITYNAGIVFRASATFTYTEGDNTEGGETLISRDATLDLRYNVVSKSTINMKFSYVRNDFSGDADSPVGYAMLEGLQNGNNMIWSLNIDKKITQVLQLNLGYEGRKTGTNDITHIGRVQMRAVF